MAKRPPVSFAPADIAASYGVGPKAGQGGREKKQALVPAQVKQRWWLEEHRWQLWPWPFAVVFTGMTFVAWPPLVAACTGALLLVACVVWWWQAFRQDWPGLLGEFARLEARRRDEFVFANRVWLTAMRRSGAAGLPSENKR